MFRTMTAIAVLASATILVGCKATPHSAFNASTAVKGLEGDWRHSDGTVFELRKHWHADGYAMTINRPNGAVSQLNAEVMYFSGRTVMQVDVEEGDDHVPVYHYGLVALDGDRLHHAPLNPEWIASHIDQFEGVYTQDGENDTLFAVANPSAMRELLRKAAREDDAFLNAETLERLN